MKPLALITLALLILGLAWSVVRADDTGAHTTGTIENAGTWENFTTTRLNTSDDSRAACGTATSCTGHLSDYNFGIPDGATIDGITVVGEARCTGAGDCLDGISTTRINFSLSWDNGTSLTAVKTSALLNTTDTTYTFGGIADTWGRTWSASDFADGTFFASTTATGVKSGDTVLFDYHAITVYYTEAPPVETETPRGLVITNGSIKATEGTLKITL